MDREPETPGAKGPTRRRSLLAGMASVLFADGAAARQEAILVAAAADLVGALDEIAAAYAAAQGAARPNLVYGSSGNFSHQIANGAPFDVFLSADDEPALRLVRQGLTRGEGAHYARGTLALAVPAHSALKPDGTLADLVPAVSEGRLRRFAIANPEHAPYGRAATAALRTAGALDAVRPFLVLGENVAQAAQFALSPATDGGIVARAVARNPAMAAKGRFADIAGDMHPPLRQRAVVMRRARPEADAFLAFVLSGAAGEILRRYGFDPP